MTFSVQEWLDKNVESEVLFLFRGEINHSLLSDSLEDIEVKIDKLPRKVRKKIFNILVELMQNLYHHSSVLPEGVSSHEKGKYVVCALSKSDKGYKITTGNIVQDAQKMFLTKHLDNINALNKEELKELYKEILDNQTFSAKGGGGLGMVDISRKSGGKLDYSIYDYIPDYYFFSLNLNILV